MERPQLLNIHDFLVIGLMAVAFFLMLGVIGEAILYFNHSRHGATS